MKIKAIILIIFSVCSYSSLHSKYIYGAENKEYVKYAGKGLALLKKKDYERALKYFYFAAQYFPTKHGKITKGNIYYLTGFCYYKLGDYDNALKWFSLSLDFNPKSLATYREIIRTLRRQNKLSKAVEMAYKVENYKLKSRRVILRVGYLFQLAKLYKRALTYYKHVLLKNPTDIYALKQSANCHIELGNYHEAKNILKRILIKKPNDSVTITLLGITYFKMNMLKKASTIFVHLIKSNRKNYVAFYNLACIFAQKKEYKKALKLLEHSLKLGYSDFNEIKNDKDLGGLRNTKDFKILLKKYENIIKRRNKATFIKKPYENKLRNK